MGKMKMSLRGRQTSGDRSNPGCLREEYCSRRRRPGSPRVATATLAMTAVMLLLLFAGPTHADNPQDVFKQANTAYANGQFNQAVSLYESVRSQGLQPWVLYYNLGNAYYRSGETGKAITNYLRAFRQQSNQPDVVYNLNLALTKVGEPLVPTEALAALFWRMFYGLSLNTLGALSSLLFISVCLSGALFFLNLWRPKVEIAFMSVLGLLVLGLWFGIRISLAEQLGGVVIAGTAEVRAAPNVTTPANSTIPEGRRVLILEEQEPIKGWLEIGVPQEGLKGWVPDTSIEAV